MASRYRFVLRNLAAKAEATVRKIFVSGAAVVAVAAVIALVGVTPASATTVATIGGCYDCGVYDTPSLIFDNTTGGTLANAQLLLTGYQGANSGLTATVNLGSLGGGTTQIFWGSLPGVSSSTSPFNLTAYDYDDEFNAGNSIFPLFLGGVYPNCNDPADPQSGSCVPVGSGYYYAQPGNFSVTFTAMVSGGAYNGQPVYSVFSPTTNATGGFVGWEGLDMLGYSENPLYDVHTGVVTGHLADINLGTPPPPTPEPSTLLMWGTGLLAICGSLKRKLFS
jgi:PEP-CTERM motif